MGWSNIDRPVNRLSDVQAFLDDYYMCPDIPYVQERNYVSSSLKKSGEAYKYTGTFTDMDNPSKKVKVQALAIEDEKGWQFKPIDIS